MDREAWWATVHRVAESDMTEATEHAHIIYIALYNTYNLLHNTVLVIVVV